MWIFEPHVAEQIFEDYVKEFGIPVERDEWLDRAKGVKKEGAHRLDHDPQREDLRGKGIHRRHL
jgi:hypothetical protein